MISRELMRLRLPADLKAWVDIRAAGNDRSMNGEIVAALRIVMKAEPAVAVVRHCDFDGHQFFAAAMGASADDFYEGASKEEAFAAARAKLKSLGFDQTNIEFRTETNKTGEAA